MSKRGRILRNGAWYLTCIVILFMFTACNLPQSTKTVSIQTAEPVIAGPIITSMVVENNCNIRINYVDHVTEPGDTVFLRRSVGGVDKLEYVNVAAVHGEQPASFHDDALPAGTYTYQVGYYNSTKFFYGMKSKPVVLDAQCGNAPIVAKPYNPILTKVEVIGGCTARVWGDVFSQNLGGVRIYRSTSGAAFEKIAELTIPEYLAQSIGPGSGSPAPNSNNDWIDAARPYDDKALHTGTYRYEMSTFNQNSEVFSDPSADVVISDAFCNPTLKEIPSLPPIFTVTASPIPLPDPQACTWEAVVNIFIFKGPGASIYRDITAVTAGTQLPIVGQSENGQFWVVKVNPYVNGYVPKTETYSRTSGECQNQATIPDPPLPPPTIAPTARPTHVPQCSDGIDNDHDGAIDMRDPGCSSPSDNSEN